MFSPFTTYIYIYIYTPIGRTLNWADLIKKHNHLYIFGYLYGARLDIYIWFGVCVNSECSFTLRMELIEGLIKGFLRQSSGKYVLHNKSRQFSEHLEIKHPFFVINPKKYHSIQCRSRIFICSIPHCWYETMGSSFSYLRYLNSFQIYN